ncbi:unnamed protein product, partial [Tuber aestivum]
MPGRKPPSNRLDSSQASPDRYISGSSSAKSSKEPVKPFRSHEQLRRNLGVLSRGFLVTSFALALLMICLRVFSRGQQLSKWEQRLFNTLSILLTAIASLGLGSLLGHLGSMLRWPLLARTMYQMRDVDLILGMSPPTCSLRLIWRHIREWRISRTTLIVTAYLVTNLVGRLSVAAFGLAYNMTDDAGVVDPILKSDWGSALWANGSFEDKTKAPDLQEYESFLALARSGFIEYAGSTDWSHGEEAVFRIGDDISPYLESDLQVSNATLRVGTNTVEYSYRLKDFDGDYTTPSNRTVHSSANCNLIEVGESQYWRWDNGNRTGPFRLLSRLNDYSASASEAKLGFGELGWGEGNVEVVSEILRVSNESQIIRHSSANWMSFLDLSNGSRVSPEIYTVCDGVAWECWPTLTETIGDNEYHQVEPTDRFFHPTGLYRLLTVGNGSNAPEDDGHRVYLSDLKSSQSSATDRDGAFYLCDANFFKNQNETIWNGYRLWMAGLVARLPILAIIAANIGLPYLPPGSGTQFVHTTLDVNWLRVTLIAVSITGCQILAILAVLGYCRGVYTRDDSHLATAELLKTIITKFDNGKLMTGDELAASLDDVLKERVSYGTKSGQGGGPPEVDLASGLDANFPRFPQNQKF